MIFSLLLAVTFGGFDLQCGRDAVASNDVLFIDSTVETSTSLWRRYALSAHDDFKPGERYEISFRARVAGVDADAALLTLVRPACETSDRFDCASVMTEPTHGDWRTVRIPVFGFSRSDYRLQFHSRRRIRAEIADLRLRRLQPEVFVPAPAVVAPRIGEMRPGEPAGAREFEVDLPCPAADAPVLRARDFGFSETAADNTAALRAALQAAKARRAASLVVEKGTYRFASDAPVTMEGFSDFTFEGGGATFVSWRRKGEFFVLRRCERVRIRNFSLDWDWARDPLASLVRVSATDEQSYELTFVDYDAFPCRDSRFAILSAFDPKTRSVGFEGGITRGINFFRWNKPHVRTEWIAPNRARVFQRPYDIAVGQLYRLQHYYYDLNGFTLHANAHVRLEDVTVLSTPGHAFLVSGPQHHTLFSRVNIVPPKDDRRRIITCTADHLHVAQSRGFIKLEDCEFSLGADDIFNMHDCSGFARRHGSHTVRTQNARAYGQLPRGTRVEIRHGDYSPSGFFGTVERVETVDRAHGVYDITFAEPVPEEKSDGFVLFDWTYDTHNVIVRNCRFHDNRARGLLILARDVTVAGNVFRHHESGAIKIETGYTLEHWSEGYGVTNVVIRNNVFDNVNPKCAYGAHGRRAIYAGIYLRTDPSNDTTDWPIVSDILIADNVFRDQSGVVAWISSAAKVTFRDNTIEDPRPRRDELPTRAQVRCVNARDVLVENNRWVPSPYVKAPGVTYDPENCRSVIVR